MPTMPKFENSPPELVARFDAATERHPQAQRRKMFGYPALFVGGNLATSLYQDRWVVRLGTEDLESLLAMPGAGPFAPMPGRTMTGWATLPAEVVADEPVLDGWLARALAFAASLPAKS
jgi:TfoX/Sxy family transcriptional regulator of competence genes